MLACAVALLAALASAGCTFNEALSVVHTLLGLRTYSEEIEYRQARHQALTPDPRQIAVDDKALVQWMLDNQANMVGRISGAAGGAPGSLTGAGRSGRVAAANVTQSAFTVPTSNAGLEGITLGPDGNAWFTERTAGKVGSVTSAGVFREIPVNKFGAPSQITTGPDGALWFTEVSIDKIGRVDATTGATTEVPVPRPSGIINLLLGGIVAGPDGRLWFTAGDGNEIDALAPTTGQVAQYPLPSAGAQPDQIAVGPDNRLWFTENGRSFIGAITTAGAITEYAIPSPATQISGAPDGAVWFDTRSQGSVQLGRITPGGQITLTRFADRANRPGGMAPDATGNLWLTDPVGGTVIQLVLDSAVTAAIQDLPTTSKNTGPFDLVTGADGNLWFTERKVNKVARMTPDGAITEFGMPSGAQPGGIAAGPDGNLWVTEPNVSRIARLTTAGAFTEFVLPPGSTPATMASGPDGNLWLTEYGAGAVARVTPDGTITPYPLPDPQSQPFGITVGADGDLWFTEAGNGVVGHFAPATPQSVTTVPLPAGSSPLGIEPGADGSIWFADFGTSAVGRVAPGAAAATEFAIPSGSQPADVAADADGNVWFTNAEGAVSDVGRVSPTGDVLEFSLPTTYAQPVAIAPGPDGNLWLTEYHAGQIGEIRARAAGAPTPSAAGAVAPGAAQAAPATAGAGGPPVVAAKGAAPVVLGSRSLRLDRRGRLAVVVTNPNTFAVSGTLAMTIAGRRAGHAKKTSKPIMIGSAAFSLQASGRVTLRLKLTPAGRAALRRRSVSATATLVTRAEGRPESRTTSQLTIRAPGRAHR